MYYPKMHWMRGFPSRMIFPFWMYIVTLIGKPHLYIVSYPSHDDNYQCHQKTPGPSCSFILHASRPRLITCSFFYSRESLRFQISLLSDLPGCPWGLLLEYPFPDVLEIVCHSPMGRYPFRMTRNGCNQWMQWDIRRRLTVVRPWDHRYILGTAIR